jgi:hypothetical protein
MSKYTKLREYLTLQSTKKDNSTSVKAAVNETVITEGLLDSTFSGVFGVWWSRFNDKKDPSDPIEKELLKQEEDAEKTAEKRLADLEKAKEKAMVAKLQAKYEAKKNKLDLANKKKVDQWKARERKAKMAVKYWKNNKIERTDDEINKLNDELDKSFENMAEGGYRNDAEKIKDLTKALAYDSKTGAPRKPEELAAIMSKDEADCSEEEKTIRANMEELRGLKNKHQDAIVQALNKEDIQTLLGNLQETATQRTELETQITQGEKLLTEWEDNAAAVTTVNKLVTDAADAQKTAQKTQEVVDNYADETKMSKAGLTKAEGNNPPKLNADKGELAKYIQHIIEEGSATADDGTKGPLADKKGKDAEDAIKELLKNKGIPEDMITSLVPNSVFGNNSTATDMISNINTNIENNISSENGDDGSASQLSQLCDGINGQLKKDYKSAVTNNIKAKKKAELNAFDPTNKDSVDNYIANHPGVDIGAAVTRYNNIVEASNDPDSPGLTPEEYLDKDKKAEMVEDPLKNAKHELSAIEARDKKRVLEVREAQARLRIAKQEEQIPEDIKKETQRLLDKGNVPGEEICNDEPHKGKLGYYDADGKFHPKPKSGDPNEEDYLNGLEQSILMKPLEKPKYKKVAEVVEESGKYKVTFADGSEKTVNSVEEVAQLRASYELEKRLRDQAENKKGEVADALLKYVGSDGKIDKEKIKNASDEEKKYIKMLTNMAPTERKELLSGLDIGDLSLRDINKALNDDDNAENDKEVEDQSSQEDKEVDDEIDADDGEEGDEIQNGKLVHPSKIWKRRKSKLNHKRLKSYEKKDDPDVHISEKEYKARVARFEKRKAKIQNDSFHYTNLGNHLFESINEVEITVKTYTKLSKYLSNNVN